jgi:hypothetical protein
MARAALTALVGLAWTAIPAGCANVDSLLARADPAAQADLHACQKVPLPEADPANFGPAAAPCVVILWDVQMPAVILDDGERHLPRELETAARAAGYEVSCDFATNDRKLWMRHLPAVDPGLPPSEAWIATFWTRGLSPARGDALCALIGSP